MDVALKLWEHMFLILHIAVHFYMYYIYLNSQVWVPDSRSKFKLLGFLPRKHNGQFSQHVREGSLLHMHPEHYLIPAWGYPNMPSSVTPGVDLEVAARFVCFCFCPLIYDHLPQVALRGRSLIYSSVFLMLFINVKLMETVSRGGPARTKACCPDSV